DVVTVSGSGAFGDNISVLLNSAGSGFLPAVNTALPAGLDSGLHSVAIINPNQDVYPDLAVSTEFSQNGSNLITLQGLGNGSFNTVVPYMAGGKGTQTNW